ncbi:MAG TPA: haloacid dehalogenase-like hydrolase [Solirubrobacteraceae bacterium]|jgi:phosphoglycolate phosphatase-like HAD superfamily hydrolase|nr:haloacid dehalogenase-like hydrolase [Solirubrobacteraceae bacterium]
MTPAVLLLFDIDGTLLIRASEAHRDAIHDGLRETFGVADPAAVRVEAAGRTDSAIARGILEALSADAGFDAEHDRFRAACVAAYERRCPPTLETYVAPGMAELLDGLSGARPSLVTGNYEPIARLKLARAGLGHHFAAGQGGFGSDAEDRALLPEIARRRAGSGGVPHPRDRTIVIGDTPRDIACARADGVRVFAVATGPFPAAALGAADAVFDDAWALRDRLASELAI